MASESFSIIGSGTKVYTKAILPSGFGGVGGSDAAGVRRGTQTQVANFEDLTSYDSFAVSGVSFGTIPVEIWSFGINPLPKQASVTLRNLGPGSAFIGQSSTAVIAPSGFQIRTTDPALVLPFMKNVSIWARSDSTAQIQILAW